MEGNTRSETSVPWAISSSYSRAGCAPGRQLHPREPSIVFWRRSGGSSGPAARPTSLAREATRFRGPPSVPLPSGRRRLLTGALSSWSSSIAVVWDSTCETLAPRRERASPRPVTHDRSGRDAVVRAGPKLAPAFRGEASVSRGPSGYVVVGWPRRSGAPICAWSRRSVSVTRRSRLLRNFVVEDGGARRPAGVVAFCLTPQEPCWLYDGLECWYISAVPRGGVAP
jgi:hypothetical protein